MSGGSSLTATPTKKNEPPHRTDRARSMPHSAGPIRRSTVSSVTACVLPTGAPCARSAGRDHPFPPPSCGGLAQAGGARRSRSAASLVASGKGVARRVRTSISTQTPSASPATRPSKTIAWARPSEERPIARDPGAGADPARIVQLGAEIDREAGDDEEHARRQRRVEFSGEQVDAAGFAEHGEGRVVDVAVGVRVGVAQHVLDPEHAGVLKMSAEPAQFGRPLVATVLRCSAARISSPRRRSRRRSGPCAGRTPRW